MTEPIESRIAEHGEKMIVLQIRFWTDSLADDRKIRPKHGWTGGVVRMVRNEPHGIHPKGPKPFNSLMDIPHVVEQVLIEHGVKLHPSSRMERYLYE